MRNLHLTLTLIVLACALAIISCNKYAADTSASISHDLPEDKTVTASVQGIVLDENGTPVQGATVTSGMGAATTDGSGTFVFNDIQMSSRFGYVKVSKAGYFSGSRSIIIGDGGSAYVSIKLIPRVSKGTFAASSGGIITVAQGDSVTFDATSVVDAATNTVYAGIVHVFAAYIDPTDSVLFQHMPGDLRGIGMDGKETLLQTYGMMVVEMEGDAGQQLQIAPGKTASLSMKIPDVLKTKAPATIPLWYFNDTTGRWIEQGAAVRKGDQYCGQTSHFTFWNCDLPAKAVNFKMVVKDQHGNPVPYVSVTITSPTYGTVGGYTDSAGRASGLIPQGELLSLRVYSNCGTLIAGANIGPALTDQDIGTVVATVLNSTLSLSGTVVDCSDATLTNGFVNIRLEGVNYRVSLSKGGFSMTIPRCNADQVQVDLTAVDISSSVLSSTSLTVDTGAVDVGKLTACGTDPTEFVKVNVDGIAINILSPPDNVSYSYDHYSDKDFFYATSAANEQVSFRLPNLTASGNVSLDSMYIYVGASNEVYYQKESLSCNVSTFGPVGGFIEGSFSGTLYKSNTGLTATGSFKLKRTF